jgi:hypothetical protein
MNKDKLARLQAQVRTGGKGSVRRKKKAVHKTTTTGALRFRHTAAGATARLPDSAVAWQMTSGSRTP